MLGWDRCWGRPTQGSGSDLLWYLSWLSQGPLPLQARGRAISSPPHCLWLPARGRTCSPRVKEKWSLVSKALRYQRGFKKQSRLWHLHDIWWVTWAMNINTGPSFPRAIDPDMVLIGSTGQDITWPLTSQQHRPLTSSCPSTSLCFRFCHLFLQRMNHSLSLSLPSSTSHICSSQWRPKTCVMQRWPFSGCCLAPT